MGECKPAPQASTEQHHITSPYTCALGQTPPRAGARNTSSARRDRVKTRPKRVAPVLQP